LKKCTLTLILSQRERRQKENNFTSSLSTFGRGHIKKNYLLPPLPLGEGRGEGTFKD